jgi:pyrroloquinoline quinone biosynthesis protein B
VWARVLGSAAGGGFPQWNCGCRQCAGVRAGELPAQARTQASLAVSADRERWFLVNATPDIGRQLSGLAACTGPVRRDTARRDTARRGDVNVEAVRRSPIDAVLLTDAELDHAAGLLSLRESSGLVLRCTAWVQRALRESGLLGILESYTPVAWHEVNPGVREPLGPGLAVNAIATGSAKRPRYAATLPVDRAAVVGYRFIDTGTGRSLLYLPCLPALDDSLRAELASADCALVDGTCWSDDELATVGLGGRTARSMGHLPVSGPDGSLTELSPLAVRRRILYTHLNNTNPLLVDDSPERYEVEAAGLAVAVDGTEIEV